MSFPHVVFGPLLTRAVTPVIQHLLEGLPLKPLGSLSWKPDKQDSCSRNKTNSVGLKHVFWKDYWLKYDVGFLLHSKIAMRKCGRRLSSEPGFYWTHKHGELEAMWRSTFEAARLFLKCAGCAALTGCLSSQSQNSGLLLSVLLLCQLQRLPGPAPTPPPNTLTTPLSLACHCQSESGVPVPAEDLSRA